MGGEARGARACSQRRNETLTRWVSTPEAASVAFVPNERPRRSSARPVFVNRSANFTVWPFDALADPRATVFFPRASVTVHLPSALGRQRARTPRLRAVEIYCERAR
jgi:hypothetical protein